MSLRDLRRHAGQLLMAGFDGFSLPDDLRAIAREFDLGGAVIFTRNVEEPAQVAELAFGLRGLGREMPAWVAVDQEGGRVARLRRPFTEWPPMITLGRADDEGLARRFAEALAEELAVVGVTLDFAPVLDVLTNPRNPVIGDRALAGRADRVAALGCAIIGALQARGIAACGKHFPGHGDTSADSHEELPIVEHAPERLREVEFVPFRAAIDAGVSSLMTAHVLVPAVDEERPATLSPRVVQDWLRDELGFDRLVFTDDLEMKAISSRMSIERAAVAALVAGCDAVLVCGTDHDLHARVVEAIIRAVEAEELPVRRVESALAHQRAAKARFLATAPVRPADGKRLREVVGRLEHAMVAEEMRRFA